MGFVWYLVFFFLGIVVGVVVVVWGEVFCDGGCVYGDILVGGGSKLLLFWSWYVGCDGVGVGLVGDICLWYVWWVWFCGEFGGDWVNGVLWCWFEGV